MRTNPLQWPFARHPPIRRKNPETPFPMMNGLPCPSGSTYALQHLGDSNKGLIVGTSYKVNSPRPKHDQKGKGDRYNCTAPDRQTGKVNLSNLGLRAGAVLSRPVFCVPQKGKGDT